MSLTVINESNFDSIVLNSDKIVLVDFWAEWCGPCRQFLPIVEEVSKEMEGKLTFCKLNVDEANSIPAKYGITGIPTLILFKNGEPKATQSGSMSKKALTDFINENL